MWIRETTCRWREKVRRFICYLFVCLCLLLCQCVYKCVLCCDVCEFSVHSLSSSSSSSSGIFESFLLCVMSPLTFDLWQVNRKQLHVLSLSGFSPDGHVTCTHSTAVYLRHRVLITSFTQMFSLIDRQSHVSVKIRTGSRTFSLLLSHSYTTDILVTFWHFAFILIVTGNVRRVGVWLA